MQPDHKKYVERFFEVFSIGSVFKVTRTWSTGSKNLNNKINDLLIVIKHYKDKSFSGNRIVVLQLGINLTHEIWVSSPVASSIIFPYDKEKRYAEKIIE